MKVKVEWSFIIFIHGILMSVFFMESECGQCPRIGLKNGIVKYWQTRLARFQCQWRFELMGEKYITCKNGEWDSKIPVCVKPGCPRFPPLMNGLDYYFMNDAAVVFFCSLGFELVGDRQLYCNRENWNGTQPICAETGETILSCTFEQSLCGWVHDPFHDFDWKRQNRKTPSGHIGTGPSYDHTLGADKDGYYMYIEGSSRLENNTVRLLSPLYPANYSKNGCFVFYYHMYGRTTDTLRLYVLPESVEFDAILRYPFLRKKYLKFEKNDSQGNYWNRGYFDLDEYNDNFQIVIEGVCASGDVSNVAIDDVAILQNEKCVEQEKEHYVTTVIPATVKDSCLNRCDDSATKADNGEEIECQCSLKCLDEYNCCPDYRDFCIFAEFFGRVKGPRDGYLVRPRYRNSYMNGAFKKIGSGSRPETISDTTASDSRKSRFLSLLTVVTFPNESCSGGSGNNGTCMAPEDCYRRGGNSDGPCANGYGACCLFMTSCGSSTSENGTYFVNNGYPSRFDGTASCQLTLMKSDPDVCQFRLDFDQFQIAGPETVNHNCENDQFIVSGGNPVPAICGNNQGGHMYIDAGVGTTNPVILTFVTRGPSFQRSWKVRITQIPCSTIYRAEEGCLQYYTEVSGQLRSFNYDPVGGLQLSNQDYSICIRMERNFCGIQYSACPDQAAGGNNRSRSFTLSGNSAAAVPAMVGSSNTPNSCPADWLSIPCVSNVGRPPTAPPACTDRICGGTLAAEVSLQASTIFSTVKPFRLFFHTDGVEAPNDIGNRGFCINYVQQPCTNTRR